MCKNESSIELLFDTQAHPVIELLARAVLKMACAWPFEGVM